MSSELGAIQQAAPNSEQFKTVIDKENEKRLEALIENWQKRGLERLVRSSLMRSGPLNEHQSWALNEILFEAAQSSDSLFKNIEALNSQIQGLNLFSERSYYNFYRFIQDWREVAEYQKNKKIEINEALFVKDLNELRSVRGFGLIQDY